MSKGTYVIIEKSKLDNGDQSENSKLDLKRPSNSEADTKPGSADKQAGMSFNDSEKHKIDEESALLLIRRLAANPLEFHHMQ